MMKLYLKKLLMTALFVLGYIVLLFILAFFTFLLLKSLIPETVLIIILPLLALFLMLRGVYRNRSDSRPYKQAFLECAVQEPIPFRKDFWAVLKSRENICHTAAFLTLDFLFALPIGIANSSNVWIFLIGMVLLLTSQGAVFTLINTLIWSLVHRRWAETIAYAGYAVDNR